MKCHACENGVLHKKTKKQIYTYKGESIELDQPGLWCDSCGEGILDGKDIETTEKLFENFKSKVDGILLPDEIRYIRKDILKISQEEAGKLFGGGKSGFSRYERGEAKPLPAISILLKMFERHPEDIQYYINTKNSSLDNISHSKMKSLSHSNGVIVRTRKVPHTKPLRVMQKKKKAG